jgi:hypothetical protein
VSLPLSDDRLTRSTWAVAHRIDGPISSTIISMVVRFSPSASYWRWSSRPVTMTCVPFGSDWLACSAD